MSTSNEKTTTRERAVHQGKPFELSNSGNVSSMSENVQNNSRLHDKAEPVTIEKYRFTHTRVFYNSNYYPRRNVKPQLYSGGGDRRANSTPRFDRPSLNSTLRFVRPSLNLRTDTGVPLPKQAVSRPAIRYEGDFKPSCLSKSNERSLPKDSGSRSPVLSVSDTSKTKPDAQKTEKRDVTGYKENALKETCSYKANTRGLSKDGGSRSSALSILDTSKIKTKPDAPKSEKPNVTIYKPKTSKEACSSKEKTRGVPTDNVSRSPALSVSDTSKIKTKSKAHKSEKRDVTVHKPKTSKEACAIANDTNDTLTQLSDLEKSGSKTSEEKESWEQEIVPGRPGYDPGCTGKIPHFRDIHNIGRKQKRYLGPEFEKRVIPLNDLTVCLRKKSVLQPIETSQDQKKEKKRSKLKKISDGLVEDTGKEADEQIEDDKKQRDRSKHRKKRSEKEEHKKRKDSRKKRESEEVCHAGREEDGKNKEEGLEVQDLQEDHAKTSSPADPDKEEHKKRKDSRKKRESEEVCHAGKEEDGKNKEECLEDQDFQEDQAKISSHAGPDKEEHKKRNASCRKRHSEEVCHDVKEQDGKNKEECLEDQDLQEEHAKTSNYANPENEDRDKNDLKPEASKIV